MQTIALIMRRKAVAQGLMQTLQEQPDFHVCFEPDYAGADVAIRSHGAKAALIEVAESGEYNVEHCLALCTWLRKETPSCKLILMCSEQDKCCISEVVAAKKDGRIDEFVFYDTSVEYLATKLMSM